MIAKFVAIFTLAVAVVSAGVLPFAAAPAALVSPAVPAAYAVAPYATSFSAHSVNHAVAAPVVAHAPIVAAAPYVAAPAPIVTPARYISSPFFL